MRDRHCRFRQDGTWTYFGGEIVKSSKTVSLRSAPISGRKKEAHYPFGTTFEIETRLASDQPPPGTQAQEYQVKVKFKEELFSGPGANVYWPIPKRAAAVHGEVAMGTRNGPLDEHAPGRERCATTSSLSGLEGHPRLEDFDARKTGG